MYDFIVSDTHFSHINICLFEPTRLTNLQIDGHIDHDRWLIDNWNNTINTNTTVLHLGDMAFKDGHLLASQLNGIVTLLIGNHDKKEHLKFYKSLGWNIIDKITLQIPNHHKIFNSLKKEFSKEQLSHYLLCCIVADIDNKRIMFSHFSLFDNNKYDKKYKKITSILERVFELSKCNINIHGHTHSRDSDFQYGINVSVEKTSFIPKSLKKLLS